MILRINIKLFNHLKATILPYCFSRSTGMFMVAVKLMDTSSYWIFLCRNSLHKSHWFKVLSTLMKIQPEHLIALNLKHIKYFSKPFHSCHLLSVWFLPFFAFFFSFSFFGQQRQLLQICKVWLIWPPQRIRTKWPYITNIEII